MTRKPRPPRWMAMHSGSFGNSFLLVLEGVAAITLSSGTSASASASAQGRALA